MFLAAIVSMMIDESVPLWFALATLVRELAISITALILGALGARRIDVTWWGKTSTFGLMVAFPLFLVSHTNVFWADAAEVIAYAVGRAVSGAALLRGLGLCAARCRGASRGPLQAPLRQRIGSRSAVSATVPGVTVIRYGSDP